MTIPYMNISKVKDLKKWAKKQGIPIFKVGHKKIKGSLDCLVRSKTEWGDIFTRKVEGNEVEEINFTQGHAFRYLSPNGEEKKATFSFAKLEEKSRFFGFESTFPYAFQN